MDGDFLKACATIAAIVFGLMFGANVLIGKGCYAQTAGMRAATDYSFLGGCRISTPDGQMIPIEIYREYHQQPGVEEK